MESDVISLLLLRSRGGSNLSDDIDDDDDDIDDDIDKCDNVAADSASVNLQLRDNPINPEK